MMRSQPHALLALALLLPFAGGCVSRPPTVAHVHIGHAITGVHVTPNKEGYMVSAERRAQETIDFTLKAASSNDLAEIKRNIALATLATLVGGAVIARIVDDAQLRKEVRASVRAAALKKER